MENRLKVLKFGGGSLRDSEGFLRCARILMRESGGKLGVLSATYNSTNLLESVSHLIIKGDLSLAKARLKEFFDLHHGYAKKLEVIDSVVTFFKELENEAQALLHDLQKDQLLSLGERICSYLFYELVKKNFPNENFIYLDARDYIKTDSHFGGARPYMGEIAKGLKQDLLPKLGNNAIIITQGFIGKDRRNQTTTLGREGSDYSAALFAYGLEASCLEIWKDVAGFYRADPKLVIEAQKIDQMSYDDASAMTESGAKILFPKTLEPMKEKKIPVFIGSSLRPDEAGTWIKDCEISGDSFLGISFVEDTHTFKVFSKMDVSDFALKKGLMEALVESELSLLHFKIHKQETNLIVHRNEGQIAGFRGVIEEFSTYDVFDGNSLITIHGKNLEKFESKINDFHTETVRCGKSIELLGVRPQKIELLTKKKILNEILNSLYQVMFS